ncbi:hypothetical protein GOP47_0014222 [Adiantum capillus-veneris]|uniref:Uncharacterized protein n=1 Tax=Adiantum capillus-veneris TaxID=13818 RepID=A0A9D4UQR4_ADICA|nr:hypothetical protein GOP47_0014222 [Adiantum capillus-veneris]
MKYCGSVDTVSVYQRVKKQSSSLEHGYVEPKKAANVARQADEKIPNSQYIAYNINCHLHICDEDDPTDSRRETESCGKCLSYSPNAPKAFGIASKQAPSFTKCWSKKRRSKNEQAFSAMEQHSNSISMANLLQRYQSIVELQSSSSPSPSSSSSSSPSTSPSDFILV